MPDSVIENWKKTWSELEYLQSLSIPRWYCQGRIGKLIERGLHKFTHASLKAYCAAAYLRTVADNSQFNCFKD